MTGPREQSVLQQQHEARSYTAEGRSARALEAIAVSLAALADLYEYEIACLTPAEQDEDGEDSEEARPS